MAEEHIFNIDQGTTWNRYFIWSISGTPVNLTGYTARMQLRRTRSDVAPVLTLTDANSKLVIDAVNGKVTMKLTAAETAAMNGTYFYDMEVVSASGDVTRLFQGKIVINDEVTQ